MKILYCRSKDPISWIIRVLTWSDWSHVVVLSTDNEKCYEARWPRVREATLAQVLANNTIVRAVNHHIISPQNAIEWCRSQVGKPYDIIALFGFILHRARNWQNPTKWFCSEFAAMAWEQGGSPFFRKDVVTRVTPQMLWMIPGKECDPCTLK